MKKKALFIGGTGTISTGITRQLARSEEWELTLLNRGTRSEAVPDGVKVIQADITDEVAVAAKLAGTQWDCVCDFVGFVPAQVERDWRLFRDKTKQYMYISSASAYQKPAVNPFITESTPLANPHWQYSRDKIACEEFLLEKNESVVHFVEVDPMDAFTDVIFGNVVDHSRGGNKKYFRWMIALAVPAAAIVALMFMVPKNAASGTRRSS